MRFFAMVIGVDYLVILECDFLSKMVGVDVVMELVVEMAVVEAVYVVRAGFLSF